MVKVLKFKTLTIVLLVLLNVSCDKQDVAKQDNSCPEYTDVLKEMKQCGYQEVKEKGMDVESFLSPDYISYSVFYNSNKDNYVVPVGYSSSNWQSIELAQSECTLKYITSKGKNGESISSCQGKGRNCRYNYLVNDDGGLVGVEVIVCTGKQKR